MNHILIRQTATFAKSSSNTNELMIKITKKLKIFVIKQVNTEVLHIAYI